MAKVTMPLGGVRARGKLGNTLVFFPWKGINCARIYVIPANPNTAAQQAQRTKMKNAVDAYHDANYNDADIVAWRRFAGVQSKPMTQFNIMVKRHVEVVLEGDTWVPIFQGVITSGGGGIIHIVVQSTEGKTIKVRFGTSPSYMPTVATLDDDTGGEFSDDLGGLTVGVTYFLQIYNDTANEGGETGVYAFYVV